MKYISSDLIYRGLKTLAVVSIGCYFLPYLRDYFLWKMQPVLMKKHHELVSPLKNAVFSHLMELSQQKRNSDDYLRILEIGAADGLSLYAYPDRTQLVVVEPFVGYRGAFDRRMLSINTTSFRSNGDNPTGNDSSKLRLEAWYTMDAEEMLTASNQTNTSGPSDENTATGPIDGPFDAAVAIYTLCSVKNLKEVLTAMTKLVKPGGLILILEHIKPPGLLMTVISILVQPAWTFLFKGCQLLRRPDRLLRSDSTLSCFWEPIFSEEMYYGTRFSVNPIQASIGFVARRLPDS